LFDARFRTVVDKVASPVGRALGRTGLSPDHLTAIGIVLSVPAAWAIGTGHLLVGLLLLIGSALPDLFDGSLAKATGRTSPRGAFFDSVGDRVSDSVVLGGFAWYAQEHFHGHAALVPLAVLGASQLVSYIRAKADALGIDAKNGLMERGERVLVLCFALKFPADMLQLLWLVFALSAVTAGQRFVRVWRLADRPPKPEPVAVRWRAWREERAAGRQAHEAGTGWWARAPRGPQSASWNGLPSAPGPGTGGQGTGRFFAGSRRPAGAGNRGGARWHERRLQRVQGRTPGRVANGGDEEEAGQDAGREQEASSPWRRSMPD